MNVEPKNIANMKQLKKEAVVSVMMVLFGLALLPNLQNMANLEVFATYVGAFSVGAGTAYLFNAFHCYKKLREQNDVRKP